MDESTGIAVGVISAGTIVASGVADGAGKSTFVSASTEDASRVGSTGDSWSEGGNDSEHHGWPLRDVAMA